MNTDNINKIFKMLGVKPNERFRLNDGGTLNYYLDCDLNLYFDGCCGKSSSSSYDIFDILTGKVHIVPISQNDTTKKEKIAIDYAKACGYKYIIQVEAGTFVATKEKPFKTWTGDPLDFGFLTRKKRTDWKIHSTTPEADDILILEIPISCVHSDDEEPFYIGD